LGNCSGPTEGQPGFLQPREQCDDVVPRRRISGWLVDPDKSVCEQGLDGRLEPRRAEPRLCAVIEEVAGLGEPEEPRAVVLVLEGDCHHKLFLASSE
jgi:hypothetical protein